MASWLELPFCPRSKQQSPTGSVIYSLGGIFVLGLAICLPALQAIDEADLLTGLMEIWGLL